MACGRVIEVQVNTMWRSRPSMGETDAVVFVGRREGERMKDERGAIGWLVIGILAGAALVVFGIIKFLIPGD